MRRFLPTLILLLCLSPARADETSAAAALRRAGATVERDEKAPGKPVFRVGLAAARPEQTALLAELPGLRELHLSGETGDDQLASLPPLEKVESLSLAYSRVRGPGLKSLVRWKGLRKISLENTAVSDDALALLAGLESLRELDLTKTNAGGSGLAALTGLVKVDLKESRTRDSDLVALGKLRNLEKIDLTRTRVSDAGMAHLAGLPKLRELSLVGTLVGTAGLASLAGAPALESLSLPADLPGGEVVRALSGSKSLLVVSFPAVSEEFVAALAAAKKLHWLQPPPTPEHPAAISQGELRQLLLKYGAGRIVPHLKGLDELAYLSLPGVQLGEGDLAVLAGLQGLRRLDLSGARGVADEEGIGLLTGLPDLRRLELGNLPVTDKVLGKLAGHPRLVYLGVARTKVSSKGLAALVAGLKKLRVLKADGVLTFADLLAAGPPPALVSVTANATQLSDAELLGLAKAGKLEWLYGNEAGAFSDPPVKLSTPPLLNLMSRTLSPGGEGLPEDIGGIKAVNFSGARLNDEGLKRVAKWEGVELLHLSSTPVSDEGLKHLVRMKSLRTLIVFNCGKVTAEGLRALSRSPSLEQVSGAFVPFDDDLLMDLVSRNKLHVVGNVFGPLSSRPESDSAIPPRTLGGPKLTGAGLKTVAGLKGLRTLWVGNSPKAMDDLDALAGAKSLYRLDIQGVQLTPEQVAKLRGHPSLRYLALGGMKMSTELLDALAKLDGLESLAVGHLGYPEGEVKRLERFKHLKHLYGLVSPTDEMVKELLRIGKPDWVPGAARLPFGTAEGPADVRSLRLGGTDAKTETLQELFEALPNVEELFVSARPVRGKFSLSVPLASLKKLRTAHLTWTWMSGDELAGLDLPESLERLTIQPASVDDRLLKAFAGRKKLHVLAPTFAPEFGVAPPEDGLVHSADLKQSKVTSAGLETLANLKNLRSLNLTGLIQIDDAGTAKLDGLPLRVVSIRGTKLTGRGLLPLVKSPDIAVVEVEPFIPDDAVLNELAPRGKIHVLLGKDGAKKDDEVMFLALNGKGVTGAGIRLLKGMVGLNSLNLNSSGATDEGMATLASLPALKDLGLVNTPVTATGLETLMESKSLKIIRAPRRAVADRLLEKAVGSGQLRLFDFATGPAGEPKAVTKLDLRGTAVSDAGLKALRGLDRLEHLVLSATPVTDAGLEELKALPSLRMLELVGAKGVSKEKVAELKKARPGLVVRP